ncbi:MAG: glycerate kinase, partial [Proteobacteria bacterium]|nr:glycerate kinase [Pseudomonadota bacterium]
PGVGGRNQEMALAFLAELARTPEDLDGVSFLAGATDGTDGPTEAAGAFADADCLEASRSTGQSIATALRSNDSHPFFAASGGLLKTGPTHTNVCDLHLTLIRPEG